MDWMFPQFSKLVHGLLKIKRHLQTIFLNFPQSIVKNLEKLESSSKI